MLLHNLLSTQGEVSAVMGELSPILHLSLGTLQRPLGPPATYLSFLHPILHLILYFQVVNSHSYSISWVFLSKFLLLIDWLFCFCWSWFFLVFILCLKWHLCASINPSQLYLQSWFLPLILIKLGVFFLVKSLRVEEIK